ncbi:MAG: hypothetical protein H0T78_11870 [Longispora sp.]|nr:hypothetical protein [Longispora sp. (in: high G+C Gram-positive bacteria)]
MGDSFVSGEGGRWKGNSPNPFGKRRGTDRGYVKKWGIARHKAELVYGDTHSSRCHRSDVAPIHTAGLDVDETINIACSGADPNHIYRETEGGQSFRGETPQADQLAAIAKSANVTHIVLSIGGNDLDIVRISTKCLLHYIGSALGTGPCKDSESRHVKEQLPDAMRGVTKAIGEIRAVMSDAGYLEADYRLILQSYASPLPRGAEFRYSESSYRLLPGRCGVLNTDSDWVRDGLIPDLAAGLRSVATELNVDFLDLRDAFQGREICSKGSHTVTKGHPASSKHSEWVRFGTVMEQGSTYESFHPNAYGQKAMGRCLNLMAAEKSGHYTCVNTPKKGWKEMRVNQL